MFTYSHLKLFTIDDASHETLRYKRDKQSECFSGLKVRNKQRSAKVRIMCNYSNFLSFFTMHQFFYSDTNVWLLLLQMYTNNKQLILISKRKDSCVVVTLLAISC